MTNSFGRSSESLKNISIILQIYSLFVIFYVNFFKCLAAIMRNEGFSLNTIDL